MAGAVDEQHIPGLAIGIVQDGRLVYARGFGLMEIGKADKPVTSQTLFHMASITKPFIATAIMQLWERGGVDLDAPVRKYVPYFPVRDPRARSITVRQMLTHTSGMPDVQDYRGNSSLRYRPPIHRNIIDKMQAMRALRAIGELPMEDL